LELLRLEGENVRGGEGRVDLRDIGASLTSILKLPEGEEVVFDRADPIETPTVCDDALGELSFHGSLGREIFHERAGELIVDGAVLVGHGGDLTRDAVAACVQAGGLSALFRFWPLTSGASRSISIAGIRLRDGVPDRFIGLGVAAVGCELFVSNHFWLPRGLFPILNYHARLGNRVSAGREPGWDRRWGVVGIGNAGILDLFSRAVNGVGCIGELRRFWGVSGRKVVMGARLDGRSQQSEGHLKDARHTRRLN
jgi:hypothetical protein